MLSPPVTIGIVSVNHLWEGKQYEKNDNRFGGIGYFNRSDGWRSLGAAHQVQPGDSIWSIAQNNGMTVKEVKTRNHLSSDIIYPDQEIIISAEKKEIDYTVEKGDCLSEIAEKHGVTSKQLKQWNQLKSDLIHPGNILIIKKETNAGSKKEAARP